ncbi:hypothetical protein K931_03371 [Aeromonas salmonicida subsp. pectinolytica 34mel]|nr:hypothetical protein K931_03371 [Aeromonas salmonicida subsp. pectinolytica 34mel]
MFFYLIDRMQALVHLSSRQDSNHQQFFLIQLDLLYNLLHQDSLLIFEVVVTHVAKYFQELVHHLRDFLANI